MIEQLSVSNCKSLEDVTLKLRPLNVFVGPNNSGKSNILDCFQFLSDVVNHGAGAVHSRGGFGVLVWNGDLKRQIGIELVGKSAIKLGMAKLGSFKLGQYYTYRYRLQLVGGPTHYNVHEESFIVRRDSEERKLLERQPGGSTQFWNTEGEKIGIATGFPSDVTCLSHARSNVDSYPELGQFASEVAGWHVYHFVPSTMRTPLPVKKELQLQPQGGNLPTVLHSLYAEDRKSFNRIVETLRAGVPELRELYTALTEQGSTYMSVEESGIGQRIPAWAMSDGTLQLLAYLAVLYSPAPPPLACFEEPENFLHPHLLQLLADLLKEASERTQILVTTHSPYLLNFMDPADLVIVEKSEGKTKVRPAHKKKGLKEALRVLGLGEMWYAGSLGGTPK